VKYNWVIGNIEVNYKMAKRKELPNILWICTDQQRYDTIHSLGNSYIHTPNLDRLCREGVAFTKTYCQSPVCTPSRASFLTGLYPSAVHVNQNGNEHFNEKAKLITAILSDVGYDCGLSGKLHLSSAFLGIEQRVRDGYREFHYSHDPYRDAEKGEQYTQWLIGKGISLEDIFEKGETRKFRGYKKNIPVELHQTVWCTDRAIEFIKEKREDPWLFSLNIFDPHPPFDAPDEYKNRYIPSQLPDPIFSENDLITQQNLRGIFHQSAQAVKRPDEKSKEIIASYYGMIELIDEQVGRLIEVLEETGQRENTIIIFTSDHGEMLGDHGLLLKGCRFYEGAVRVPLIISCPGRFGKGVVCSELVELTDIAPTLAEVAGIKLNKSHGKSLIPLLEQNESTERHREFVRCEYYDALNPYAPDRTHLHVPAYATMFFDGRYKLITYHGHEFGELYDLETDPDEFNNLWNNQKYFELKLRLMKRSFDESILIVDHAEPLIGSF